MDKKKYAAGEVIFKEGQTGKVMYILLEGTVEIRKKTPDGNTLLKVVDRKNEVFGEMALIDDFPRSASAVAVDQVVVYEINETAFEHLVKTNGNFAYKIIQILSERVRNSNVQISDMSVVDLKDRIQRGMVDYARIEGETIYNGGIKVNIRRMSEWINNHMGISMKDLDSAIRKMIKQETIPFAASGEEEVILSPDFITSNERRRVK